MIEEDAETIPWIDARSIHARRGAQAVLAGVDLVAFPGELVVVSGANGTGKSTLLEILALLRVPDAGELRLFGAPSRYGDLALRRRITLAMQPALLLRRSVLENVRLGLAARGMPRSEALRRANEALEQTGVLALASRRIDGLSAGERQRLNLARALALPVDVLLLDEPTANLDENGAASVRALLVRLCEAGNRALVVATPEDPALLRAADRLVRLGSAPAPRSTAR